LEGKILTAQNEPILDVISAPFILKKGMNVTSQLNLHIASTAYNSSEQANYIKTSHTLPSGKYHYCAIIKSFPNDIVNDEYCQDLESDFSSFLFLVSPPDKDEIETKYPVLLWTHSEPFSLNSQSEYYRMIVTDLFADQSAEAAVNTNIPVYMKNYLTSHSVLYPVDAKELEVGKKYAWQVQKLNNGTIVNKTEAWEFKLKAPAPVKENKYAVLKKQLDADFYTVDRYLYFTYDENYDPTTTKIQILDSKRKAVDPKVKNDLNPNNPSSNLVNVNKLGDNRFSIDMNLLNVSKGYYTLEVTNSKNELYLLKFYVQ
ncbi:MAG TPA: hypothetical protein VN698_00245, partial [Bacteroidia bacterium]|nr:hypothetical protein [Bacteroidia bacterium]